MSEGRLIHDRFSHLLGTTTHLSVEARVEYVLSAESVRRHFDVMCPFDIVSLIKIYESTENILRSEMQCCMFGDIIKQDFGYLLLILNARRRGIINSPVTEIRRLPDAVHFHNFIYQYTYRCHKSIFSESAGKLMEGQLL